MNFVASCDGRVVKASDSKSDGFSRVGSNPTRSVSLFILFQQTFLFKKKKKRI